MQSLKLPLSKGPLGDCTSVKNYTFERNMYKSQRTIIDLFWAKSVSFGVFLGVTLLYVLFIYLLIILAEFLKTYLKMGQNIRTESWR